MLFDKDRYCSYCNDAIQLKQKTYFPNKKKNMSKQLIQNLYKYTFFLKNLVFIKENLIYAL